ncbi:MULTISPECIES: nuclear transport factor 2 family protein [unclassified Leptolyngbya]|uniref:nuclear transport factor 2 family protein n=1 Tax=unclassified Leptolyngbya TaxID=2650499 RepID=UPI001686A458|nr:MULTISPECIES: nuclear transport factor 2 family protein [unclassified Leptolyngbya]MBD1911617.1 nuclear transport factor 2 family protein [Leptolyngbya sp. FACHB-8]MBD2153182.1 nuclear transport factor 2 family protein [Leptolyngbya sp. FACHB-16]
MTEASAETLQIAQDAFQDFCQGLAQGEWSAFLNRLSEDFTFWFPAGPFQGLNVGADKAKAFFEMVSQVFPEGLTLTVQQITSNATTVVFEVRSQGLMLGKPYENQAAIAFDIKNGQVCSYREYLNVVFQR